LLNESICLDKRDATLDILLARLPVTAAPKEEDPEQAQREAIFRQLEEERIQTLAAAEAELKAKYEEYHVLQVTLEAVGLGHDLRLSGLRTRAGLLIGRLARCIFLFFIFLLSWVLECWVRIGISVANKDSR
jgi:hypothetical protein